MNKTLVKYQSQLTTFGVGFIVGYTQHYQIAHSLHTVCAFAALAAASWAINAKLVANRKTSAITSLSALRQEAEQETIEAHTIDITQKVNA